MSREKTYSLPVLPGQMKAHHHRSDPVPAAGFYVEGEVVWIPLTLLAEVKPPLPPEPPVGSFVNAGPSVLHRGGVGGIDWWSYSDRCWYTWAQVCELGTPVRLTPAPEPVELPWSGQTAYGSTVSVLALVTGKVNDVANDGNGKLLVVTLTPDLAREKARALNTAADKAEAEATS